MTTAVICAETIIEQSIGYPIKKNNTAILKRVL
jgi:hypothetical protein